MKASLPKIHDSRKQPTGFWHHLERELGILLNGVQVEMQLS
ncbi:MAG TPA: hypothetical protein VFC67_27790 [Prolixibacteraceae bacterium]|nr:hypothetical protein [Prolixibacteraceae bacterium]